MGKKVEKARSGRKAEQRLAKARAKFEATQQRYLLVREQGKQEVERARLAAERKLTKVNEQLEKRAHALSLAEQRSRGSALDAEGAPDGTPASPEGAADTLERLQEERAGANGLMVPGAD